MSSTQATLADFQENPWENKNLHPSYRNSFLNFGNAPEYAPSEVLLASLYRQIGLQKSDEDKRLSEATVGTSGNALLKAVEKKLSKTTLDSELSVEGWLSVIDDIMKSPKQTNQRGKRFLQMTPVVPSTAIYSMAARQRGHPWNPGGLIESCICLGEKSKEKASRTWHRLFDALSVRQRDDDAWAIFLENQFARWNSQNVVWQFRDLEGYEEWTKEWQDDGTSFPATRFVRDLAHLIKAKSSLTRRHWTSAVESLLRIGVGAHVLWVCKVNSELFSMAKEVLKGEEVPALETIRQRLSTGEGFWSYGQQVGPHIKKLIRYYLVGRIGLNMILHRLNAIEGLKKLATDGPFKSVTSIHGFLASLSAAREKFDFNAFDADFDAALEADTRKLAIRQGVGKNVEEFLRHSLGQRETQERGMESYDQGFLLRRGGSHSRAPWVLTAGPVMILTLVFACTSDGNGVRTVEDLCKHLREYGIAINPDGVATSELGKSLRTLGLVLDSPDAEGGMVLLNPFGPHATTGNAD